MASKSSKATRPLASIRDADLSRVAGGRKSWSGGPDARVIEGIKQLAEVISVAGQNMANAKQSNGQMMMQVMMQAMQNKKGA
jgi:hypothetical protein